MNLIIFVLLLALGASAQTTINGSRSILGAWDASGATSTKPLKSGTATPGTCSVPEMYFETDATAGTNIWLCTATNTWTQVTGAGLPSTGGTGIVVQTGASTTAARSILVDANEIALTNPDGVSGNLLLAFASNIDISSKTFRPPGSNTLPVSCTLGQIYFDRDATAGQNLYGCTATNVWTLLGGGSADPNTVTAAGTLTSNAPMIGAGSKAAAVGSRSGNTTEFATVSGTKTASKQLAFDASGNIVASAYDTGGTGVTSVAGLADGKITITSTSIVTVGAYSLNCQGTDGRWVPTTLGPLTYTRTGGTESGTARFQANCNGGSPQLEALYDSSMTASNYSISGGAEVSGSDYSSGSVTPLGSVTIVGGDWTTATDARSLANVPTYTGGDFLTLTGNDFDFDTTSFLGTTQAWTAAHSSDSTYNYCADAGANDTYACSISPAITAYATGAHYFFKANTVNTGAATINFNSLGAKTIKKYTSTSGADLADADIRAGAIVEVVYDGTNMQLVNQLGNAGSGGTPGGSTTQVQYNSSSAFAGSAGLTWDDTNRILYVTRSNVNSTGGYVYAGNTAGAGAGDRAGFLAYIDNNTGSNAEMTRRQQNLDGTGAGSWALFGLGQSGSYYNVTSRNNSQGTVHIGGGTDAYVGWTTFTSTAMSRFADAATAGRGLASIQGAPTELTGQTGNVAAQTLLASSHTAGTYRVCGFASVTATGTGSTVAWTLSWRSPASGTDLTHNLFWSSGAAETDTFSVATANEFNVCKVIRSTGASAISLDPGDMNTATYTTAWTVERLR